MRTGYKIYCNKNARKTTLNKLNANCLVWYGRYSGMVWGVCVCVCVFMACVFAEAI